MLFGSLHIIENSVSCFMCRVAWAGKVPETRKTKDSVVLGKSLRRFSVVVLTWCDKILTSGFVRIRAAIPEKRTGEPKVLSALKEESGLALCLLDMPADRTAAKAPLWLDIRCWM